MELFSEAWAAAWGQVINADEAYGRIGQDWDGPVVLRRADQDRAGVFVSLSGGVCREARAMADGDEDRARIVIEAPDATWRSVLAGEVDPVTGLVTGRLSLSKGSLLTLLPHQQSARALLAAATRVGQPMASAEE